MSTNEDVDRIIEILDFRSQPESVKKKHVRRWFDSTNASVIGAGLDAILRNWECVEPPFTRRELGEVLMKNFQISLRGGVGKLTHYAYSCHEAAREFCGWVIASHAAVRDVEAQDCLHLAKDFLEREYRTADEPQRNCIVAGALEHLFEVEGLAELFAGWQGDPLLSQAYAQASEWSSWARSRSRSLHSVAERTLELMRRRGVADANVRRPAVGTTMPVITWADGESHELAITCDETWVRHFEGGRIDEEKAAAHAADAKNWVESGSVPGTFMVELHGETFARGRTS
jgi:hypothetical protein